MQGWRGTAFFRRGDAAFRLPIGGEHFLHAGNREFFRSGQAGVAVETMMRGGDFLAASGIAGESGLRGQGSLGLGGEESAEAFDFLEGSRASGVMIDVGAHQGGSFASFASAGWTIHAFEPDPRNQRALQAGWGSALNVHLNAVAVGIAEVEAVSFAVSSNSFIGSLTSFDDSHKDTISVPLRTLKSYCDERGLQHIDLLKVDAEGHDLDVLKGFPWECIQPRFVICEFEDRKQGTGKDGFKEMAQFLSKKGYSILVSEWDPVLSYHGPFCWKRFFIFPGDSPNPMGNGNLLAVRSDRDFRRLRLLAAFKTVTFRGSQGIRLFYRKLRGLISR
jgi:FkbM family methyltransferase